MSINVEFNTINPIIDISSEAIGIDLGDNSNVEVDFIGASPIDVSFDSPQIHVEFTGSGGGGTTSPSYDRRSDYDTDELNYLYTGTSLPGANEGDPVWKISRFNMINGTIEYANGDELFTNVYDDRESLSYS